MRLHADGGKCPNPDTCDMAGMVDSYTNLNGKTVEVWEVFGSSALDARTTIPGDFLALNPMTHIEGNTYRIEVVRTF